MQFFGPFDYAVIILYFLGLIALGFYFKMRASRSLEHYFLGDRQLPWYLLGISGIGSSFDLTGTMLIVSFLYMMGPRGLFVEFRGGANLILIFMMLWTGKWHRRSGCMTAAEWNIFRFGPQASGKAARLISVVVTLVTVTGMLAYAIKGNGLFLATFLPFRPFTCAVALCIFTTAYTVVSGFYGVVFTDLFQCLIVVAAVVIITVMAVSQIGGYDGNIADLAASVTGNPTWVNSAPTWHTPMPAGYEEFQPLMMIACFYLLRNIMAGAGSGADPRYFGSRSKRECGLLTFFWSNLMTLRWPLMFSFAVLGLFLMNDMFPDRTVLPEVVRHIKQSVGPTAESRWPDVVADIANAPDRYPQLVAQLKALLHDDWANKLQMVGYNGTINPERIVGAVLFHRVARGCRGILFIALIGASMSVFNSQVNLATGFFTKDVYQAFLRPKAKTRELILASYVFGVVIVLCGLALGYTTPSINNIWDWIIMGLGAGVAVPLILRLYWHRFNAGGVVIGTAIGLITAVLQHLYYRDLGPWQKFVIVTGISLVGTLIATYLTPPTDRRVLEHFYRTTRPFGFWGPFRHLLSADEREHMRSEHLYDVLCVPFALIWQVTLFLMPMQLILRDFRSFAVTFPIFAGCLFFLYRFWYRRLPPAEVQPSTIPAAAQAIPEPVLDRG